MRAYAIFKWRKWRPWHKWDDTHYRHTNLTRAEYVIRMFEAQMPTMKFKIRTI